METVLYDQFLYLVQAGDEEGAREFVAKHINEFSEATKIAIFGGALAECLADMAQGAENLADTQEKSLAIVGAEK